jgi:hypothetical protein
VALRGDPHPPAAGEQVDLGNGRVGERKTAWDTDHVVRTREEMASVPSTESRYSSVDPADPNGKKRIYTPERVAEQQTWKDKLYHDGEYDQGKQLHIVTGLPAAGKSSIMANPLAKKYRAFLADNDEVKSLVPEFDGGLGAGVVHEESSMVGDQLFDQAMEHGDNIVLPMLGGKTPKLEKILADAEAEGYKVYVHLLDAPPDVSMKNTVDRFHKPDAAAPKGRFVAPEVVQGNDDSPRKAYEEFVATHGDRLAGWSRIKNGGKGKLDMVVDHESGLPDDVYSMMRNKAGNELWLPSGPPRSSGFLAGGGGGAGRAAAPVQGAIAAGSQEQQQGGSPLDVAKAAAGGALLATGQRALLRGGVRPGQVLRASRAVRAGGAALGEAVEKAAPQIGEIKSPKYVDGHIQAIFGRDVDKSELAKLTGAPSDARVDFDVYSQSPKEGLLITANHPSLQMPAVVRVMEGQGAGGGPKLRYEYLFLNEDAKGSGKGVQMMADSVAQAEKMGIPTVDMHAVGAGPDNKVMQWESATGNGYYTWARMGFDTDLSKQRWGPSYGNARRTADWPEEFRDAKSLNELMAIPGGAEFWKANGWDNILTMDTNPGSTGRQIMAEYLKAKGLTEAAPAAEATAAKSGYTVGRPWPPMGVGATGGRVKIGDIYSPTAANEAILDEVWRQVGSANATAAAHAAGTVGGAYAGYQSTPEEASPLERAGREIVVVVCAEDVPLVEQVRHIQLGFPVVVDLPVHSRVNCGERWQDH